MTNTKADIKSMNLQELTAELEAIGEKPFRAKQIFSWLHAKRVNSFADMSNLSAALRETCDDRYAIHTLRIRKKLESQVDGTIKYLYELPDGNCVETVLMRYHHGVSLCVSTQVGCRMGCRFCASTMNGLVRSLAASEILEQVYVSTADSGERIGSIVLMGIGEPLDNFDHVLRFIELISHPDGYGLGQRHIALSTCGLVPQMDRLAEQKLAITLSVSLHSPDNASRSALMPVNQKYPVEQLIAACKRYFQATGRRVSFEYALIGGETDSAEQAKALVQKIKGFPCHVNLIPVNPVEGRPYQRSAPEQIQRFQREIERAGIPATVRRELGPDIMAACGQLRHESAGEGALQ